MKTILCTQESKIFERIVRARDGRLFRVRFVVVERDGVLRGKAVSCTEVLEFPVKDKGLKIKDSRFYLPVWLRQRAVKDKGLKIKDFFPSPYFNKFDFLTAIKIRAPSIPNL